MTERLPIQPWMISPASLRLLDALEAEGGPDCARFVGGCVRNAIMGVPVADIDISTRLRPDRTMAALAAARIRYVPTGVEHGTVTAIVEREPYEVTSLRRDVETDGRRAVVAFSDDWAEDAQRRDFRLNALYADREGRLYDYAGGGIEDAKAGRIVFVGDAETRLREDYLRILRFFRFHAWYGHGAPDAQGYAACVAMREGLKTLSGERIAKELLKLLAAADPGAAVKLMAEGGLLEPILPPGLRLDRFARMVRVDADPLLRLSALLPDDPTAVGAVAERLRLSNDQRERLLEALPSAPPVSLGMDERRARAAIYQLGAAAFADRVRRAWAAEEGEAADAERLLALAANWPAPKFPLRGQDVIDVGVPAGPKMGMLLREVETWWIAQDFPTDGLRERLAELAKGGT
jgi:poly(A) polymerase